ncbi:hypothetical protein MHBO_001289 [Bonamia ostreae]|uniref:Uncharacterized protein n=1 Tax=Bonamia ostreae TaxID=126728 RepID=A0ABV2AIF6_9EUKA
MPDGENGVFGCKSVSEANKKHCNFNFENLIDLEYNVKSIGTDQTVKAQCSKINFKFHIGCYNGYIINTSSLLPITSWYCDNICNLASLNDFLGSKSALFLRNINFVEKSYFENSGIYGKVACAPKKMMNTFDSTLFDVECFEGNWIVSYGDSSSNCVEFCSLNEFENLLKKTNVLPKTKDCILNPELIQSGANIFERKCALICRYGYQSPNNNNLGEIECRNYRFIHISSEKVDTNPKIIIDSMCRDTKTKTCDYEALSSSEINEEREKTLRDYLKDCEGKEDEWGDCVV